MRRTAFLLLLLGSAAFGYVRENTCFEQSPCADNPPIPLIRVDNTGIQFYLNNQVVPGLQSSASGKSVTVISADSDPQGAAAAAAATWNAVGTANVTFLPIQATSAGHAADGLNVILVATNASDVSVVGGAIGVTVGEWATAPSNFVNGELVSCQSNCMYPARGDIFDSDILLNPSFSFSTTGETTTDLQATLTHEMGHSLGANHTQVLGATMFPYASLADRILSTDDLAFVNAAYPATSGPAPMGTIAGEVTLSGAPVPYALVDFLDTTHGTILGAISGTDGTYSVQAPTGTYIMYAEPFNGIFQPANLYFTSAQAALVQTIQPTFYGSTSNPSVINLAANNVQTVNLAVTAGAVPPTAPYAGFGSAGGVGDILNVSQITGPMEVASGQSVDFAFIGTGFDKTTTLTVLGPGITATALRVDPATFGGSLSGQPLLRTTLTIAARTSPALATLMLTNGTSTLTLSGVLVIGPVQPSFIAGHVVNAGYYSTTGVVAPGEIVSIYGTSLGPPLANIANYLFSSASILDKDIGNTRVLFDGIPAPLLVSYSGQVNAIVPYEVAGKTSTQMVVEYEGVPSAPVQLTVSPTSPGILPGAQPQQGLAQNSVDFSVNGPSNPVARGSFVTFYGTGEGQTNPAGIDGLGSAGFNGTLRVPVASVSATVGGIASPSTGAATVDVSGLVQINVQVPSSLTVTGAVPVIVTIGGASAASVNIYVK